MVLGMLFENFKNYYILRYVIYEFLKKVLGVPQPTCLVRVFCAVRRASMVSTLGSSPGERSPTTPPSAPTPTTSSLCWTNRAREASLLGSFHHHYIIKLYIIYI